MASVRINEPQQQLFVLKCTLLQYQYEGIGHYFPNILKDDLYMESDIDYQR